MKNSVQKKKLLNTFGINNNGRVGYFKKKIQIGHFPSPPPAPPLIPSAPNHKDILTTQPPPPPMLYSTQTTNSNYGGYQSQNISNRSPVVYVYELPYNIRKSICDLLGMIHYD